MRTLGATSLLLALPLFACARLASYETPVQITGWQDPAPPRLTPQEKADAYQARIGALHQLPDGMIRYRMKPGQAADDHGDLADGPFFLGLYLASQALRFSVTHDESAHRELLTTLDGMALLLDVTGRPGLLARWVARSFPPGAGSTWHPSSTRPGYVWRGDVSKDQLAGYACGLGVALALVPEPEIRERVAALAVPVAEHLRRNGQRIVGIDGERTKHGNLSARIFGFPIGVNALIALAMADAAAGASGDDRLAAELERGGFLRAARWAYLRAPGSTKRVNENMAYASLLPLLLLAHDSAHRAELEEIEARLWRSVRGEHNAFFASVHALASGDAEALAEAESALAEFPDRKQRLPVDLTRPGFDFETRVFKGNKGLPRAVRPIPLYLRPSGSNLWVGDPYALVGSVRGSHGTEFAGIDYLLAYWLTRAHAHVPPQDPSVPRG